MRFDGRKNILEISDEERTVYFETWKPKKISGSKIGAILGYSEFATPFKVACELAGIYPGDGPNKYIDAGNILEPVIRDYVGHSATRMLTEALGEDGKFAIELPVPKEMCGYDHFHDSKLFGGMVDGYVLKDGKRDSIFEVKTSSHRDSWTDSDGNITKVPMGYLLQASLYAELSGLDRIVFAVGFLEESDYQGPSRWKPTSDNTYLVVKEKPDMAPYLSEAESWYREYILSGYTPEWSDKDAELLKYLRAGVTW